MMFGNFSLFAMLFIEMTGIQIFALGSTAYSELKLQD
jgi:hypothetical protein